MNIIPFSKLEAYVINSNGNRNMRYVILNNMKIIGRNCIYPNCLLLSDDKLISPYDEKVMSLNKESFYDDTYDVSCHGNLNEIKEEAPVFFFIYNFDNYYHFIYDTLPYLCCYFKLKETICNLKLLVAYPNISRNSFYKFNEDIFELFNIKNDMIIHTNMNVLYTKVYVANSLTHGGLSNHSPHPDVYNLFKKLKIIKEPSNKSKRIYISRRTWIHNDKSNLGTDYTQRRKMENEDLLVERLTNDYGFEEVFCENLSMIEKIELFQNADFIIGAIGGGMCNLLFSPSTTKVICIVSPHFLNINYRFKFSMDHTNIQYLYDTETTSDLYRRVNVNNRIGEIVDIDNDCFIVQMSNNDVAGFNNLIEFEKIKVCKNECEFLDKGLNSPYIVDIDKIIIHLKNEN